MSGNRGQTGANLRAIGCCAVHEYQRSPHGCSLRVFVWIKSSRAPSACLDSAARGYSCCRRAADCELTHIIASRRRPPAESCAEGAAARQADDGRARPEGRRRSLRRAKGPGHSERPGQYLRPVQPPTAGEATLPTPNCRRWCPLSLLKRRAAAARAGNRRLPAWAPELRTHGTASRWCQICHQCAAGSAGRRPVFCVLRLKVPGCRL